MLWAVILPHNIMNGISMIDILQHRVRKFRTTTEDNKMYETTYYDPWTNMSIEFFKIVQNKLHYAVHGHITAEVIYNKAKW